MTRDLQEIKRGVAQCRAALNLLEKFVAEYESRGVNVLPCEDVRFYAAPDDDVISGAGIGSLESMNGAIRATAAELESLEPA